MQRHEKVNIGLGIVGSIAFVTGALVTASRHETFACVALAVFANIWIGRTIHLLRRARRGEV